MTLPQRVLDLWFAGNPHASRQVWFQRDDAFDAGLRRELGEAAASAAAGALDAWGEAPEGALALVLLLDQLPRNLHRGSPEAFAADPAARQQARRAVLERRFDLRLTPVQRAFLYLPFEHSEAMAEQDLSVVLFEGLRDAPGMAAPGGMVDFAWRHWQVIRRFGRFPHRNAVLGRHSAPAEAAYLAAEGAGF
ncbi:DUF924 family protein [Roseomonas sp. BN140053]|uniref:DUF924 family protein n=1 Tax=Roseomonas sp. BN140053 TaxID=3391898 RepID=UPI0039E8AF9E